MELIVGMISAVIRTITVKKKKEQSLLYVRRDTQLILQQRPFHGIMENSD